MPYNVDLQVQDDHIRVEVSGDRRLGDSAINAGLVVEQTADVCKQTGINLVLVVLKLTGRLSPIDSYEMVIESKDHGWSHQYKLAFVDLNNESFDDVQFTETVAVNRAYQVKAFNSESDALAWLRRP